MRFPENMGPDLGGKTFQEVFDTQPKWIECVRSSWTDKCTGLFLEFYNYVHTTLAIPRELENHENRCIEYVKSKNLDELPKYLIKYGLRNYRNQDPGELPQI